MRTRTFALASALLLLGTTLTGIVSATAKKKDASPCAKPPDLVAKGVLPKEQEERAQKIRAQGSIAIVISEDGEVVGAKVVNASSSEAGKLLMERAKGMKFKARTGCGPFKTVVNFTLAE